MGKWAVSNKVFNYQGLLLLVGLRSTMPGVWRRWSFNRLWSAILCPRKSPIASGASGSRFCPGAITLQMAWLAAFNNKIYLLGGPWLCHWCTACPQWGHQGSDESSNRTLTVVMISYGQYLLVNVLIVSLWCYIAGRGIKSFLNQLFTYHFPSGSHVYKYHINKDPLIVVPSFPCIMSRWQKKKNYKKYQKTHKKVM